MQKSNFVSVTADVNLTTVGAEFSNYDTINSDVTTTVASGQNGFLCGDITVASGNTWTIASGSSIKII